jgi:hypothetical protein
MLRRSTSDVAALPELTAAEKSALLERLKREEEEMAKKAIPEKKSSKK